MIKADDITKKYREKITDFNTVSGIPVKEVYTAEDISKNDIGLPGEFPFARGHHPLMYRGKLWNIREIAGHSSPSVFNERCKLLLEMGQGVLDWEIDGPTMYGIEPDQPYADGQLGVVGVTIHALRDVEALCKDMPLDALSISSDTFFPDIWQS